jgi:hypothetical protein
MIRFKTFIFFSSQSLSLRKERELLDYSEEKLTNTYFLMKELVVLVVNEFLLLKGDSFRSSFSFILSKN